MTTRIWMLQGSRRLPDMVHPRAFFHLTRSGFVPFRI